MNKAERTDRTKNLSRVALGLARSAGIQGYIELDGNGFGVFDFTHNEVAVGYLRSMDADVPSRLDVRYLGAKVLSIEWVDRRITKATFKPGEWERSLLWCAKL